VKLLISIEGHLSYTLSVEDHNLHRMHLLRVPGKHFFLFVLLCFGALNPVSCYSNIFPMEAPLNISTQIMIFFFFF
jgi:hypothetical protein